MFAPHPLIESLLTHTGFADVAKLCHFKIDHHLATALVEQWRPETHIFHLPVGECTITLEDVALQLGIKVDGRPIIGATCYDWEEMCEQYLGVVPPKGEAILIGGVLMPYKMGNQVHLMYLTVLVDLDRVRWYSWGSTCLATMYREMCSATDPDAKTMGSCASLLQSGVWYRMLFIAARVN
ncbi:Serine/threonine-protein phosphatase 7 long form [Glycine max]|nr:Serine/threonine-protein phosphatase 7 long form [Glycine max]